MWNGIKLSHSRTEAFSGEAVPLLCLAESGDEEPREDLVPVHLELTEELRRAGYPPVPPSKDDDR